MSNPENENELKAFEAKLSALVPRDDRLDRERLAFLAGQASMACAPARPERARGLHLESRAWPAAFAAMSAVAATLLFLLIARPETPNEPTIATNDRIQINRTILGDQRYSRQDVLTTQDVRSGDLEARFAKIEAAQKESDTSMRVDERTSPVFTPSAWRQAIYEMDSPRPLPRKSSNLPYNRGTST